ncbi:hypothetical protein BKA69DRAFT_1167135 [Paraphysoderma sedebokerense]|nr:hypothetical protein BKA69DRAFT_1167135 [Paraphysoderma sedebokerense]
MPPYKPKKEVDDTFSLQIKYRVFLTKESETPGLVRLKIPIRRYDSDIEDEVPIGHIDAWLIQHYSVMAEKGIDVRDAAKKVGGELEKFVSAVCVEGEDGIKFMGDENVLAGDVLFIEDVYVEEEFRGTGVGLIAVYFLRKGLPSFEDDHVMIRCVPSEKAKNQKGCYPEKTLARSKTSLRKHFSRLGCERIKQTDYVYYMINCPLIEQFNLPTMTQRRKIIPYTPRRPVPPGDFAIDIEFQTRCEESRLRSHRFNRMFGTSSAIIQINAPILYFPKENNSADGNNEQATNQDNSNDGKKVGYICAYVIQRQKIDNEGRNLIEECDTVNERLYQTALQFFDEYNEMKDKYLKGDLELDGQLGDVLFVDEVVVEEEFQGLGLGLFAVNKLLEQLPSFDDDLVLLQTIPMRQRGHFLEAPVYLKGKTREQGMKSLISYWSKIGFKMMGQQKMGEYMYIVTVLKTPDIKLVLPHFFEQKA